MTILPKGRVLITAGIFVLWFASSSVADTAQRGDGNDTPGSLDISSVRHAHDSANEMLVHRVKTYGSFGKRIFKDTYTQVLLDFYVGGRLKRTAYIDLIDGELVAIFTKPNGEEVARVPVTRPNRKSVKLAFPPTMLGSSVERYEWRVVAIFHKNGHSKCDEDKHGNTPCSDEAPNRGLIAHSL